MANPDVFALKNSALNPFLFSEVGPELNGSALTVLSVLARLGEDPWSQALSWTKLPRVAVIDRLADRIGRMPLRPQALLDARITASRLILLLPSQNGSLSDANSDPKSRSTIPKWVPLTIFYCALAIAMAMNVMSAYPGSVAIPAEHTSMSQPPSTVVHPP